MVSPPQPVAKSLGVPPMHVGAGALAHVRSSMAGNPGAEVAAGLPAIVRGGNHGE